MILGLKKIFHWTKVGNVILYCKFYTIFYDVVQIPDLTGDGLNQKIESIIYMVVTFFFNTKNRNIKLNTLLVNPLTNSANAFLK